MGVAHIAQHQWERFNVDDVIPLVMRTITTHLGDTKSTLSDDEDVSMDQDEEIQLVGHTPEKLREFQLSNPDLKPMIIWIEKKDSTTDPDEITPTQAELSLCSVAVRHVLSAKEQLQLVNGVLYYIWEPAGPAERVKFKFNVPCSLHDEVLVASHDSVMAGHFGIQKTLCRVRLSFYWHLLRRDVVLHVQTCAPCDLNKKKLS